MARLRADYALPPVSRWEPLLGAFNEHYLISTSEGRYVLRIYRQGWRTSADVAYELAALMHLAAGGVPVCAPVAGVDGALQCTVPWPEGPRIVALFDYAPGQPPDGADPEVLGACGRLMGLIHRHGDSFSCVHQRFHLDLKHLLDQPLAALLPYLGSRRADAVFLRQVACALRRGLAAQVEELEWGFCHGDFHGGNLRMEAGGTLRVFDFDCGGLGWRAYDLAVARLYCREDETRWRAFCGGYREVRPIPKATMRAIPWFMVTRQLWRMAAFAQHCPRLTGSAVDDRFLDEHLGILRQRACRHLPEFEGG